MDKTQHLCPLIILFHVDKNVDTTLSLIFGTSTWIDIDLAEDNRCLALHILMNKRKTEIVNVCLRHAHHRSARKYVDLVCTNNIRCKLKVVVHCNEYLSSGLSSLCFYNAHYILLKKTGRNHGWPQGLFRATHIPESQVIESTCDLVGISHRMVDISHSFIEWRLESEAVSRARIQDRCAQVFQELAMKTWHPSRMQKWCLPYDDEFCCV